MKMKKKKTGYVFGCVQDLMVVHDGGTGCGELVFETWCRRGMLLSCCAPASYYTVHTFRMYSKQMNRSSITSISLNFVSEKEQTYERGKKGTALCSVER